MSIWVTLLYQHQNKHANTTHVCEMCQKIFDTKKYLKQHKIRIHETKTFECEECDVKFTIEHNLKRHIKTNHNKAEYFCKICGAFFHRVDTLKKHYRMCKSKTHEAELEHEKFLCSEEQNDLISFLAAQGAAL